MSEQEGCPIRPDRELGTEGQEGNPVIMRRDAHLAQIILDEKSAMPFIPGYWMHETSGDLARAVTAYLQNQPLDMQQIALIRAYLRQWMQADWLGDDIEALRADIDAIETRADISRWLHRALDEGIDPL